MKKRSILVTGGAGFIGSHLVDRLLAEGGWKVTVIDDFNDFYSPAVKHQNVAKHLSNPDFELVWGDICSGFTLKDTLAKNKFETIVHLAARAGVRPSLADPAEYARTNVDGTVRLLEAARQNEVRQFVFGSSSSVYGINAKVPFAEEDPIFQPISPYAATKAAGEMFCHAYAHLYRMRCLCLRFFTVYGARQRPDLAIHKFAALIREGRTVPVYGDGSASRDYTYIDDIVDGIRAAIDYRESPYEVINLGESQTIELKALIGLLEKELGKKALINYFPAQPGDVPQTYADIAKAGRLLGYRPRTRIEEGIRRFVRWFETQNPAADREAERELLIRKISA
jgi:UDP-glucuronate 4-epimerase